MTNKTRVINILVSNRTSCCRPRARILLIMSDKHALSTLDALIFAMSCVPVNGLE